MAPPLLLLQDIHLTFGGTPLLEGAELSLAAGERVALVGRNGSGKSTLLKIAAGLIDSDHGSRFLQPGATLRYLPQEPDLSGHASVADYVAAGLGPGDDPYRARRLLDALGLSGTEDPAQLSGGEVRRAALVRVLAPEPDILLLDEATNHLDLPAIEWLEEQLKGTRSALVLISHDRRFLEDLSGVTVWLDRGRTLRRDEGFAGFEAWRDTVLEEEELASHKLDRKLVQEADWLRYGVTARRKRNQGRLRALHDLRAKRRALRARQAPGTVNLTVQEAATSGKLVIEARHVGKSFGERLVVRDFSLRIERGDRIGIVGPNGAGKTTLLGLLTGTLPPDGGTIRLGTNLEMATLDQKRESLDPDRTVTDALTDGRGDSVIIGGAARHVASYMKDFLFKPEQARTPLRALSGGERGRLMLARALARPANLLVLDEPTNDLDLETLDLLEDMLADHPGTVLVVSHDRDFLDRVASSVIAYEGDGNWIEYAGGYSDMVAQRGQGVVARPGPQATPTRTTPKSTATRSDPKRKLSFRDKHSLETLPQKIAALNATIAALEQRLADPTFYQRDPTGFAKASAEHDAARTTRDAAEEDWLRLEMLREEIEG